MISEEKFYTQIIETLPRNGDDPIQSELWKSRSITKLMNETYDNTNKVVVQKALRNILYISDEDKLEKATEDLKELEELAPSERQKVLSTMKEAL